MSADRALNWVLGGAFVGMFIMVIIAAHDRDTTQVSMGDDDGSYVQAWVWVPADEARQVKKEDNRHDQ